MPQVVVIDTGMDYYSTNRQSGIMPHIVRNSIQLMDISSKVGAPLKQASTPRHSSSKSVMKSPPQRQQSIGYSNSPQSISYNPRYKTELCHSFKETGFCSYNEKCQFAHGESELREVPRHPKRKTEKCKNFHSIGMCMYGDRCDFIHNEPAPEPIAATEQPLRQQPQHWQSRWQTTATSASITNQSTPVIGSQWSSPDGSVGSVDGSLSRRSSTVSPPIVSSSPPNIPVLLPEMIRMVPGGPCVVMRPFYDFDYGNNHSGGSSNQSCVSSVDSPPPSFGSVSDQNHISELWLGAY